MRARILWTSDYKAKEFKEFADYNELVKYCFSLHDEVILQNGQRLDEIEQYDVTAELYDDWRE
jgi:hypothetical protein